MAFRLIIDPTTHRTLRATEMMPRQVKKGMRMGAFISGKQLVNDLRSKMSQRGRSGRTYRITRGVGGTLKSPRDHRASSPRELPAVITGTFRKSIDFKVRGTTTLEFGSGNDGLAKGYAKALETGTSKMKKRQPLRKTVNRLQNQVNRNITREINKQIGIK